MIAEITHDRFPSVVSWFNDSILGSGDDELDDNPVTRYDSRPTFAAATSCLRRPRQAQPADPSATGYAGEAGTRVVSSTGTPFADPRFRCTGNDRPYRVEVAPQRRVIELHEVRDRFHRNDDQQLFSDGRPGSKPHGIRNPDQRGAKLWIEHRPAAEGNGRHRIGALHAASGILGGARFRFATSPRCGDCHIGLPRLLRNSSFRSNGSRMDPLNQLESATTKASSTS